MIDEMTAMNEEIIELTAEVGVLRAFVAKVAKLAGKDLLTDYDARVLATFYIEQAVGLAANVTSEEPQANESKFKVGDEVLFQRRKYSVEDVRLSITGYGYKLKTLESWIREASLTPLDNSERA